MLRNYEAAGRLADGGSGNWTNTGNVHAIAVKKSDYDTFGAITGFADQNAASNSRSPSVRPTNGTMNLGYQFTRDSIELYMPHRVDPVTQLVSYDPEYVRLLNEYAANGFNKTAEVNGDPSKKKTLFYEANYYPNRPPLIMHEVIGHGYFGWNHAYGAELEKARASAWAEAANYGYKDVAEDGSNHLQVSFLYAFVDNYFSNQHFHIWHAIMNDPSLDVYGKLWSSQLGFDITYH